MLILASASPRRKELLERAGIDFEVRVSSAEEICDLHRTPEENTVANALAKAKAVRTASCETVLAADTVVCFGNKILGKPSTAAEAFAFLSMLSGQTHTVCTGWVLLCGDSVQTGCERTAVTFFPLTREEIASYIATGEPMDKAGGYGIQSRGFVLVEKIDGDYSNVVGLPTRAVRACRDLDGKDTKNIDKCSQDT